MEQSTFQPKPVQPRGHCQKKPDFDDIRTFSYCSGTKNKHPLSCFKPSPEIIRLAVIMYVRLPLSFRNVEDLFHERGIDICHGTVRPLFASEIRNKRFFPIRNYSSWRWHVGDINVNVNGETRYLWLAVDHEGEMLEA